MCVHLYSSCNEDNAHTVQVTPSPFLRVSLRNSYQRPVVCSGQQWGQFWPQSCPTAWRSVRHHGLVNPRPTDLLLAEPRLQQQKQRWTRWPASRLSCNTEKNKYWSPMQHLSIIMCLNQSSLLLRVLFLNFLCMSWLCSYLPLLSEALISAPQSSKMLHISAWVCLADNSKGVSPSFGTKQTL